MKLSEIALSVSLMAIGMIGIPVGLFLVAAIILNWPLYTLLTAILIAICCNTSAIRSGRAK